MNYTKQQVGEMTRERLRDTLAAPDCNTLVAGWVRAELAEREAWDAENEGAALPRYASSGYAGTLEAAKRARRAAKLATPSYFRGRFYGWLAPAAAGGFHWGWTLEALD